MIKLFIPISKGRAKTEVRGFWYSQDTARTYYDYLKVVNTSYIEPKQLEHLKKKYNQECIAYIDTSLNCLEIYYNKNKIEVLKNVIYTQVIKGRYSKDLIKNLLKRYNGLTIYIKDGYYLVEAFYNREV